MMKFFLLISMPIVRRLTATLWGARFRRARARLRLAVKRSIEPQVTARSLVCCALLTLIVGCQQHSETATSPAKELAMKVTPIKAERKTLTRRTEQPGEIEAFETAPLMAKVSGYVRRVLVDIGDPVTGPKWDADGKLLQEGQLLAEIDVPELAEDVKQRAAVVQQAAAAVKVAEAAKTSAEALVAEAQASVDRAEAMFRRWDTEYARVRMLAESNAVTQKVADETEQQFKAADAARRETASRIKSAMAKLAESAAGIEKSKADLLVAQADADKTQALWSYTQIRAPFDGIVSARQIDTGHLVTNSATGGKSLLTVVAANTVRLYADVPEADAASVQTQREAKVKLSALGGAVLEGQIARTSWVLHAGTRTLRVQIDLPNSDGRLRPGMSAQVDLLIAQRPDALAVPKSAVLTQDGQAFVMKVSAEGVLKKSPVTTGLRTGTEIEITSGLSETEPVLGANLAAYRDGQTVEVSAAPAASK